MCEPVTITMGVIAGAQVLMGAMAQNKATRALTKGLNMEQLADNELVAEQMKQISGQAAQEQFETHVAMIKAQAEIESNAAARNAVGISVQDLLQGVAAEHGRDVATIEQNRANALKQTSASATGRRGARKAGVSSAPTTSALSAGLQIAGKSLAIYQGTRPSGTK